MILHELGHSGRKVASFVCYQGSYIRLEYQFIYDRDDYARPTPPGFDMELDNEMDDSVRTVNMMDASSRLFDMSDVAAVIAEADELPVWCADNVEEYFPPESLEINKAGEIIVTLKHGDSKILITPEHSLYARLKAIIDSGASVCIFNQPKYFKDFVEHPITIRTADNPIVAEEYGAVGKLQNCLLVTALQKNLISVSHACRDLISVSHPLCVIKVATSDRGTNSFMIETIMQGLHHLVLIWK